MKKSSSVSDDHLKKSQKRKPRARKASIAKGSWMGTVSARNVDSCAANIRGKYILDPDVAERARRSMVVHGD